MTTVRDPDDFLRFVVEYLYDLIGGDDLAGGDGLGLNDALTTDDQIAYLRKVYDEWMRVYARPGRGSEADAA